VRAAHVDREVGEHPAQPIGCERLEARQHDRATSDADHLGQRLDGVHEMLEHLGRDHRVEGAVAEGEAGEVERDGVIEPAQAFAVARQVQPMHQIGVVGIHPVALANHGRQEPRPRAEIDEALEGEAVEPAKNLEHADEVLEVLLREPPRRAAVLVHEIVGAERVEARVVLGREPAARPEYDGLARPRSHLAYSFSK
jgi:hypothetical protein